MSALPLMKNLGWLTVREMIDFDINKMINKSLNAIAPDYLRNIFQSVSEATNRQLRNSKSGLRLPFLRTSTRQKSFAYREGLRSGMTKVVVLKCPHPSTHFEENIKPKYNTKL